MTATMLNAASIFGPSDVSELPRKMIVRNRQQSLEVARKLLTLNALEIMKAERELLEHSVRVADIHEELAGRAGLSDKMRLAGVIGALNHDGDGKIEDRRGAEARILPAAELDEFNLNHTRLACLGFMERSARLLEILEREEDREIIEELVPPHISCHHNWSVLPQENEELVVSVGLLIAADKIDGCRSSRPYRPEPMSDVQSIGVVRSHFIQERAVSIETREHVLGITYDWMFEKTRTMSLKAQFMRGFHIVASL